MDLFTSEESMHCQLFFLLRSASLEEDALSSNWPKNHKHAAKLAKPVMVSRVSRTPISSLVANSPQARTTEPDAECGATSTAYYHGCQSPLNQASLCSEMECVHFMVQREKRGPS